MDLATMRDEFKASTGGSADDLSDADIDEKLNRFYRYVIPSDVDGAVSEILWSDTMNTVYTYASIPSYVVTLNRALVWIDDAGSRFSIPVYSDLGQFALDYPDAETTSGRPTAACISGRAALFWNMVPDQAYEFSVPCRGGSSADLTSLGIGDEIHALATVHGAAWHYLLSVEDEAGAAREGNQYAIWREMLQTRSTSFYKARTPARSF